MDHAVEADDFNAEALVQIVAEVDGVFPLEWAALLLILFEDVIYLLIFLVIHKVDPVARDQLSPRGDRGFRNELAARRILVPGLDVDELGHDDHFGAEVAVERLRPHHVHQRAVMDSDGRRVAFEQVVVRAEDLLDSVRGFGLRLEDVRGCVFVIPRDAGEDVPLVAEAEAVSAVVVVGVVLDESDAIRDVLPHLDFGDHFILGVVVELGRARPESSVNGVVLSQLELRHAALQLFL